MQQCKEGKYSNLWKLKDKVIFSETFVMACQKHPTVPTFILTFATVSPMGHGRCGDRVANTPILPPFSLGTLTYPSTDL